LREPASLLLLAFALGIVAAGIAKLMYIGLEPLGLRFDALALADDNPVGLLLFAIFGIGPIEELAKLLPFVLIIIRLRAFNEPLDGIIYASFIGLGYAAVENFQYQQFLSPLEAAARGFAGPVVHILFASIWAHWITRAWLAKRSIWKSLVFGFLIAASLHGLYDFLVLLHPVAALPIAAALIIAIWIWRLTVMRRMHNHAVKQSATSRL
jgi:RsiW-degrading membrane proteinase PrsW (M82 family)